MSVVSGRQSPAELELPQAYFPFYAMHRDSTTVLKCNVMQMPLPANAAPMSVLGFCHRSFAQIVFVIILVQSLHGLFDEWCSLSIVSKCHLKSIMSFPQALTLTSKFNAVVRHLTASPRSPSPFQHFPSKNQTFASSPACSLSTFNSSSASA